MFCKACGEVIPDDSTFCSYCGVNQVSSESEEMADDDVKISDKDTTKKIVKGVSKAVMTTASTVASAVVVPVIMKSSEKITKQATKKVTKKLNKTADKAVDAVLKGVGLKKTPVDYMKGVAKDISSKATKLRK